MNNRYLSIGCQRSRKGLRLICFLFFSLLSGFSSSSMAEEYSFVVQPILSPQKTIEAFTPLTEYLSEATGHKIRLVTALNFLSYWETMKKSGQYDFILDAAHLTDYRQQRMGYQVLVKRPDVVSYTLVTSINADIIEPEELIGKSVATIGSPSLGMLRVDKMFPNPLRQPMIVEVNNSTESIQKVLDGKAIGAMIPTPLVGLYPDLVTIVTTEQVPHTAISAAPSVPDDVKQAVRNALVSASTTERGKEMLTAIKFPGFEPTNKKTYKGFAGLLEGTWGY